ncbi:MAG: 4-hydroxythreonine-4-phosphate dehydrogenase PdxA [Verrucomicrobiota bacterium]|nr:4-hydroxythreonine-4-phosphate dehydrogenase PdxA [Verrucomicrobiota bacterium]
MKKIALTCGDPSGVGPEVIAAWARANPENLKGVTVIGPMLWLEKHFGDLPVDMEIAGPLSFEATPGDPTATGAKVAFEALDIAAAGCKSGRFNAVVTGPISKAQMREVGFHFAGQTEFFADRWGGEPTMGFVGEKLRVVLATWHDPLMRVASLLQDGRLLARAVRRAHWLAKALGATEPRIAVCGLNPHAGEEGLIGREEIDMIDPQLKRLREQMPGVSLTLPGDTVFWRALKGDFDIVVALYHDQGLAPLKTVDFENAVNITLGLPWIRTSPDHGTGFAIAGKGLANAHSIGEAVALARKLEI